MVKLCFTYRAGPQRTIETRRGISIDLQTEDVYTELGTDPLFISLNYFFNQRILKNFTKVNVLGNGPII